MAYGIFPQDKWQAFLNIEGTTRSIRKRAETVVALLSDASGSVTILGNDVVKFLPSEGEHLANIALPVGHGRIILNYELADQEMEGVMVVERKRRDAYEKEFWEPVWDIRVPKLKSPFYGPSDARREIDIGLEYDNMLPANPIFTALITIVYGIVNGPVKA